MYFQPFTVKVKKISKGWKNTVDYPVLLVDIKSPQQDLSPLGIDFPSERKDAIDAWDDDDDEALEEEAELQAKEREEEPTEFVVILLLIANPRTGKFKWVDSTEVIYNGLILENGTPK